MEMSPIVKRGYEWKRVEQESEIGEAIGEQ